MAERYLPVELQDKDGNVMYPHSEADVIWMQDGQHVQKVLGDLATFLAGIDGVSSMTNLDDDTKLATAKAVASLNTLLDTLNRNITADGKITGYEVREGDGVYITYRDGADTVTKKLVPEFVIKEIYYQVNGGNAYTILDATDFSHIKIGSKNGGGTLNIYGDNIPIGSSTNVEYDISDYSTVKILIENPIYTNGRLYDIKLY